MFPSPWHWDLHAPVVLAIAALAAVVARGHRASTRAGAPRDRVVVLGLVTLAVALVSPLAGAADTLFWAHMTQHMLLTYVAPLLLVAGDAARDAARTVHRHFAPTSPHGRALRRAWYRRRSWCTNAFAAAAVFNAVLWAWHLPAAYDAAVHNDIVHAAEHSTLFAVAWWFWASLFGRNAREPATGMLALFLTAMSTGALGSLLIFAGTQWYPAYHGIAGLGALTDQQVGGVIMNAIALPVQLVAIAVLFARWMALEERRAARHDPVLTAS
jgi:cytochrome c oxidase assembly factor CtaG